MIAKPTDDSAIHNAIEAASVLGFDVQIEETQTLPPSPNFFVTVSNRTAAPSALSARLCKFDEIEDAIVDLVHDLGRFGNN